MNSRSNASDEVTLKIANHVWAVDLLREIWNTVGSPNIGVAYCQGMYIIGFPGHEEVPLDEGDVDIAQCVKALAKAGYDGLIIPEHLGNGNMAEAVIYLKSL